MAFLYPRQWRFALACFLLLLGACGDKPAEPLVPLTDTEALLVKGSQKARMCSACHGPAGISRVASYPSIAGQSREHLAEQLHAFRSGARDNPMMSSIARSLSDDDIAALAVYFAAQPAPEPNEAQP